MATPKPHPPSIGEYVKMHLTRDECAVGIAPGVEPKVFDTDVGKVAVAICFDLYFPELFEAYRRAGVSVIAAPSYQRYEPRENLRAQAVARAMDTGAYVVRSSYHLSEAAGGCSGVYAPDGRILAMVDRTGCASACARSPKCYGPSRPPLQERLRPVRRMDLPDAQRSANAYRFPRLVAHRGWPTALPENSLAGFGAAIAAGASEIECDVRTSADGATLVIHDGDLDRTTTGTGPVEACTAREIRSFALRDAQGRSWPALRVPLLREVLDLCRGRAGLNLHVKSGEGVQNVINEFAAYCDTFGHAPDWYIAGDRSVMEATAASGPRLNRCYLGAQDDPDRQIDEAVRLGCARVQLGRRGGPDRIRMCRDVGLIVNYFYSNEPDEAAALIDAGVDAVLTDDFPNLSRRLKGRLLTATRHPS